MEFLGRRATGLERQIPEKLPDRRWQVTDLVRGKETSAQRHRHIRISVNIAQQRQEVEMEMGKGMASLWQKDI